MKSRTIIVVLAAVCAAGALSAAQISPERERARPHYRIGWDYMRIEAWADAAKAFQQAIDTDSEFEDAHYSLGRAYMNLKKYGEDIVSYTR